jgi:hypothetical protein
VNQPSELVLPPDLRELWRRVVVAQSWLRRDEPEAPVRAMAVVVLNVDAECVLELTATQDHDPVEAFASDRR